MSVVICKLGCDITQQFVFGSFLLTKYKEKGRGPTQPDANA